MPPPPLSMTTIRTGVVTSRSAASPPMSCRNPSSPVTIVVGRPLACAAPIPEEMSPSIPFARDCRGRARRPPRPHKALLVPDRHRGSGVDERLAVRE